MGFAYNITMAKKKYCTKLQEDKRENFLWKNKILSFLSSFETVVHMLKCISFTVLSHVPPLYLMYPIWIKQTMCHKP